MKFTIATATAFLSTMAAAGPIVHTGALPAGMTLVPMTWTGEVVKGAGNVTLTGTIEEVYAKVIKMNPNFVHTIEKENLAAQEAKTLSARAVGVCDNLRCGADGLNGGYANRGRISQGIDYLHSLGNGQIRLASGFGICSRISCSYNSAIYLCNDDNDHQLGLAANFAGDMAAVIIQYSPCWQGDAARGHCFRGPYHDGNSDNYNVWVRTDTC